MKGKYEMRFTGSGGQGVIMASVIIAEAAILSGMNAVQSQSYGPEARGGTSKAETIISDTELWFSKVTNPDFLLALTQSSLDTFGMDTGKDCVLLMDKSLRTPAALPSRRVFALPILATARETLGKPMTANIVAVGAINRLLNLFDEETLCEAVRHHIPAGTEELNMRALALGESLAEQALNHRAKGIA